MKEIIEEAAEKEYPKLIVENPSCNGYDELKHIDINEECRNAFVEGAKWMQEQMYSEGDMIDFVEYVALYPDKNRNHKNEMLHAKSKYDGAERTIDLLEIWVEEFK